MTARAGAPGREATKVSKTVAVRRGIEWELVAKLCQAIALDPMDALLWTVLGALLQVHLVRYEEAEQAYLHALEFYYESKDRNDVHGLLAYLYWFHLGRPEDARRHAELGRQVAEGYLGRLLDAARHLAEDAPGPAFTAFDAALATDEPKLWRQFLARVQRHPALCPCQGLRPPIPAKDGGGRLPRALATGAPSGAAMKTWSRRSPAAYAGAQVVIRTKSAWR